MTCCALLRVKNFPKTSDSGKLVTRETCGEKSGGHGGLFAKVFRKGRITSRIAHRSSTTIDCHRHPPLISAGCQGRLFYRRPMQATSVYSKTQQRCSQSVPADGRPVPEQCPRRGDEDETGATKAPGSGRTQAPESYQRSSSHSRTSAILSQVSIAIPGIRKGYGFSRKIQVYGLR